MTIHQTDDRRINEVRIKAARLLKAAKRGDANAHERLGEQPKLRRALDVVAKELTGLPYLELLGYSRSGAGADPTLFFAKGLCAHWNHWFARYEDARAMLDEDGGYLFPHRNDFMVLDADAMRTLSLDPDDPDWTAIGHDWVRPADMAAFSRLSDKLCVAGYGSHSR